MEKEVRDRVEEIVVRLNKEMGIPLREDGFWINLTNCCLDCFCRNLSGKDVDFLREVAKGNLS